MRDFRRVQDLVLMIARWLLLAALVYAIAQAPGEPLVPLPILVAFGLYTLFITIAFLGGWIGTTGFAYIQSVGDLALVAGTLFLAPALLDRTYMVLLVVAALIGLRRFAWGPTMGFAVLAAGVGALAQRTGLALVTGGGDPAELLMPVLVPALAPGLVVVAARLVAGDPIPAELLNRRPPMRDDQVRALQGLSKTIGEQSDREPLLKEAYRVMLNHTGAVRAAILLVDPTGEGGETYAFADGQAQVKPVALAPEGTTPHERVLREGRLRLTRQRQPLPVVDVVGERGAASFAGVPMRTGGHTLGALLVYDKDGGRPFVEQDEAFLELLAPSVAAALFGGASASEAAEIAELFPQGLLAMLALRRPEAEAHAEQVARFAVAIGEELGLSPVELDELRFGALLHDVGELGVAGDPFNRLQPLSSDEYERVKEHPAIGQRVLAGLNQPHQITDMVHQHHERWDGTGYPQGIGRGEITNAARILAVADALDAMTAERPYRASRPVREALQELVGASGTQFDPSAVQALLAVVSRNGEGWVAAPPRLERRRVEPWRGRMRR